MSSLSPFPSSPSAPSALERPRLISALSSSATFVALVGPVGAEAATLLRQWASQTSASITWAVAEAIPDTAEDVLIIEDATSIDAAGWEQVRTLRRTHPRLLIRTAVHSFRQVPPEEEAEFIFSLSLTLEETSEYLYRLASHLDPRAVHLATGGLPAAVRAVAHLKTMRSEIVDSALATLSPGPLDAELAVLAAPEALTQELVVELGGPSDFIDRAERAGWGKWTSTLEHPLFMLTAPVRAATAQAHPSDRVETVREQAGRFLLQQGAWYGALIEGAAARSLPVIDAALRGAGMPLLKMHGVSIAARLRGFHVWELRRWPIVALALALIYNARHEHRVRAVELMGVALLGARTAPSGSAERALLRVIESVLQRLLGTGDSGVKAARDGSRMIRELPSDEYQSVHGLLGDMHSHAAVSLLGAGKHAEALADFERALATTARPGTELLSLGAIAWITAHSGDITAAQRRVQIAVARPWSGDQRNGYLGCLLRIAEAQICIEKGQLDAAENAIDSIWHMIDTVEYWPLLAHVRAQIDICRGRAGVGLERLRALRRHRSARISREYTRLLDLADSGLALAAGDPVAASALVTRAGDSPLVALGAARAVMFAGQYERALRMLGSITAVSPAERTHAAVLEAVVLHRLGRASDAARAAQHAVTVAEAYELTTPFLLVPVDDRELLDIEMPWPTPTIRAGEATASLTDRECVILRELVDTASASAIADHLHVSVNTVKSQRRSLYRKLGVTSRQQALTAAVAQGLLGTRVR